MLLNLSNHPFEFWPENQKEAAIEQYGSVEDMPFPQIDPSAERDHVMRLAEDYLSRIKLMPPATVHLMGELTFCYMLANMLREAGIYCVASTTERKVTIENDTKTAVFTFVRFRPYY